MRVPISVPTLVSRKHFFRRRRRRRLHSAMELSAYESERLRNILANERKLAELGLLGASEAFHQPRSHRPAQRSPRSTEPVLPLRNSSRSTKGYMPPRLAALIEAGEQAKRDGKHPLPKRPKLPATSHKLPRTSAPFKGAGVALALDISHGRVFARLSVRTPAVGIPASRSRRSSVAVGIPASRSRRSSVASMTAEEAIAAAASEGLELIRAPEGKGKGMGSGSLTGYKCVVLMNNAAAKPYRVQVWRGGTTRVVGCFATAEEGALAYARFIKREEKGTAEFSWALQSSGEAGSSGVHAIAAPPPAPPSVFQGEAGSSGVHAIAAPPPAPPSVFQGEAGSSGVHAIAAPPPAPTTYQGEGDWLAEGSRVEVRIQEAGLEGSRFEGRVVRTSGSAEQEVQMLVRYMELLAEDSDGALLEEWVPLSRCRPAPPPPPANFVERFVTGDRCDLWFEDAWWDAEFVSRGSVSGLLRVRSVQYDVYHEVEAARLRPAWIFADDNRNGTADEGGDGGRLCYDSMLHAQKRARLS